MAGSVPHHIREFVIAKLRERLERLLCSPIERNEASLRYLVHGAQSELEVLLHSRGYGDEIFTPGVLMEWSTFPPGVLVFVQWHADNFMNRFTITDSRQPIAPAPAPASTVRVEFNYHCRGCGHRWTGPRTEISPCCDDTRIVKLKATCYRSAAK
jgi:hypothetical protein